MSSVAMFKLFLTGYAIVGILYVCVTTGAFSREQQNWWASLSDRNKAIFVSGIAATVIQSFL
jgi:hypothetical protein